MWYARCTIPFSGADGTRRPGLPERRGPRGRLTAAGRDRPTAVVPGLPWAAVRDPAHRDRPGPIAGPAAVRDPVRPGPAGPVVPAAAAGSAAAASAAVPAAAPEAEALAAAVSAAAATVPAPAAAPVRAPAPVPAAGAPAARPRTSMAWAWTKRCPKSSDTKNIPRPGDVFCLRVLETSARLLELRHTFVKAGEGRVLEGQGVLGAHLPQQPLAQRRI